MTERGVREKSVGYAALVWQQFGRNRLAVIGLGLVALLFVMGTFAPFLANSRPLLVRVDPQRAEPLVTWRGQQQFPRTGWFSPLVENLSRSDVILLILFGWAVLQVLGRLSTVPADNPTRRAFRLPRLLRRLLLWMITLAAVALIAWTMTRPQVLPDEKTDWESIVRSPSPGDVFHMPPIPYRPYQLHPVLEPQRPDWQWWGPAQDAPPETGRSWYHWLGTDQLGRDVASQLIHGARISMSVGFVSVGIAIVIGTFIGALGGYFGRWVDFWVMRLVEVMVCFPTIFLILTVSVILPERSIWSVMVVIGVTSWTGAARLVRGEFFKQRAMEYVTAAQAVGDSPLRVMFRHILPNAMAPLLVTATFGVAGAIITEATLSFLNLGVPPDVASWGRTLSYGLEYVRYAWWLVMFPGFAIFLTVTSYNLAGEGLRDAIDPRMRV